MKSWKEWWESNVEEARGNVQNEPNQIPAGHVQRVMMEYFWQKWCNPME